MQNEPSPIGDRVTKTLPLRRFETDAAVLCLDAGKVVTKTLPLRRFETKDTKPFPLTVTVYRYKDSSAQAV